MLPAERLSASQSEQSRLAGCISLPRKSAEVPKPDAAAAARWPRCRGWCSTAGGSLWCGDTTCPCCAAGWWGGLGARMLSIVKRDVEEAGLEGVGNVAEVLELEEVVGSW